MKERTRRQKLWLVLAYVTGWLEWQTDSADRWLGNLATTCWANSEPPPPEPQVHYGRVVSTQMRPEMDLTDYDDRG